MASYIPNFHGPYLWKSGLHVAIFQALGLSRVLGLGDYLHVIGVIRHYGSLADGLVTFWPVGTVVVWHVNVYPGMLGHYYCIPNLREWSIALALLWRCWAQLGASFLHLVLLFSFNLDWLAQFRWNCVILATSSRLKLRSRFSVAAASITASN